MRRLGVILAVGATCAGASGAAAEPIPEKPTPNQIPEFVGRPATPQPLSLVDAPTPPRHPFMAPNERSNLHDDAYQTDTYHGAGPARARHRSALVLPTRACAASVTFDSRGRIVTVCVGLDAPDPAAARPGTLEQLARWTCRRAPERARRTSFTDFAGGGYFYLDDHDRAVIPTTTRHVFVVGETAGAGLRLERDYDLTGVGPAGDKIISRAARLVGPDLVRVARGASSARRPDERRGAGRSTRSEPIGNSFAVDETGGVYIVTDEALYRFDAAADGAPQVDLARGLREHRVEKPGQTRDGLGHDADADGPRLRRDHRQRRPDERRGLPAREPVDGRRGWSARSRCSRKGASATDKSLIGTAARSSSRTTTATRARRHEQGGRTTPGVERVDIDADGKGCHTVWHSRRDRAVRRAEALAGERARLHVHEARRARPTTRGT